MDQNFNATAIALTAKPDGDAVPDVVDNGAVLQRTKHNGGWSRDTTQIG